MWSFIFYFLCSITSFFFSFFLLFSSSHLAESPVGFFFLLIMVYNCQAFCFELMSILSIYSVKVKEQLANTDRLQNIIKSTLTASRKPLEEADWENNEKQHQIRCLKHHAENCQAGVLLWDITSQRRVFLMDDLQVPCSHCRHFSYQGVNNSNLY